MILPRNVVEAQQPDAPTPSTDAVSVWTHFNSATSLGFLAGATFTCQNKISSSSGRSHEGSQPRSIWAANFLQIPNPSAKDAAAVHANNHLNLPDRGHQNFRSDGLGMQQWTTASFSPPVTARLKFRRSISDSCAGNFQDPFRPEKAEAWERSTQSHTRLS